MANRNVIGRVGKARITYRRGFTGAKELAWVSEADFKQLQYLHELYSAIWEAIHDPRIILSTPMKRRMEMEIGQIVLPSSQRLLSLRVKLQLYKLRGREKEMAIETRSVLLQLAAVATTEFVDTQEVVN
ncbi:MAG: hypothetical protein JWP06_445 [Candidatus Saccharibacteria bacterium]|nr:hypothetical protein [Candidatus Saccharibacteria bacterium]